MRREDLIVAALCLGTSVMILVESVPHYFGDHGGLGSGAYPCYLAFLFTVCGVSILVQWFRGSWWTTLALSFVFVGLVSYTFHEWPYMALPRGLLGF
jgi:hypothetical protein